MKSCVPWLRGVCGGKAVGFGGKRGKPKENEAKPKGNVGKPTRKARMNHDLLKSYWKFMEYRCFVFNNFQDMIAIIGLLVSLVEGLFEHL